MASPLSNLIKIGNRGVDGEGTRTDTASIGGVGGAGYTGLKIITPLNTSNRGDRITGTGGNGGTGHIGLSFSHQFILEELDTVMLNSTMAPGQGGDGGTGIENSSHFFTHNGDDLIIGLGGNGGVGEHGVGDAYCPRYGFGATWPLSGIPGKGGIGIANRGYINTGNGNDVMIGRGGNYTFSEYVVPNQVPGQGGMGIANQGEITTGNGNDVITGMGGLSSVNMAEPGVDILNSGRIDTDNGNDIVQALTPTGATGRWGGGGHISLGQGDDLIVGYGFQRIDGGRGFDTAQLGIAYNENLVASGGSSNGIAIGDMTFTGVERFIFTDATYSLSALQALI